MEATPFSRSKDLRRTLYCFLLCFALLSCDSFVAYPILADEDALLKLQCVVGESDSTVLYVSKVYMITHGHRPTCNELLNSSLRFIVNGEAVDYKEEKGTSDKYVIRRRFRSGDRIEVFCSAPGVPDVTATTVVPELPQDLIKDFVVIRDGRTIVGKLLLNYSKEDNMHISAYLQINNIYCNYKNGILTESNNFITDKAFTPGSDNIWEIYYDSPAGHEFISPTGDTLIVEVNTEFFLKLNVLSKELYYWDLHQQSSIMSPSSYTNVKGGLGYVGAVNQYTSETFLF